MPKGELRIGANPNANGGVIRNDLKLPNLEDYEVKEVAEYGHGWGQLEATPYPGCLHSRHHQEQPARLPHLRTG